MEKQNTSNKKKLSIIVALLFLLISGFLLSTDGLFSWNNTVEKNAIGKLYEPSKDVRRKLDSGYSWSKAKNDESLLEGDSIFTGAESTAQVKLINGHEIKVSPNSLVKISLKDNRLTLDIPYGDIHFENSAGEVVINDCGKQLLIAAGDNSAVISKGKDCGSIKVKTKSPITAAHLKAQAIAVELDESVAIQDLNKVKKTLDLSAPKLENKETVLDLGKQEEIPVKWTSVENAKVYIIETSPTPDFSSQVKRLEVQDIQFVIQDFHEDTYYRVQATDGESATSSYSEVGFVKVKYPAISFNQNRIKKEFQAKTPSDLGPQQKIDISWSKVPQADTYLVEVKDAKGKKQVFKQSSRMPSSTIKIPQVGNYKYTVKAIDAKGRQISSSGVGEVIYERVLTLLAPVIKNEMNQKFYFFQKGVAKYIPLNWILDSGSAEKYRVEVAKDPGFDDVVKSMLTSKKSLVFPSNLDSGDYYWRVRSENQDGYSLWSNVESFKVKVGQ